MDILSNFGETLNELIFDNNLTAETFSQAINIDRSVIYKYLRKETLPSLQNLIAIADYFACSTDCLVGLTHNNAVATFKKAPPFSLRFKEILDEHKLTRYGLRKQTKFAKQSIDDWFNGTRNPSVENAVLLARHFDISLDNLLGRE